jgi:hypothetical protein
MFAFQVGMPVVFQAICTAWVVTGLVVALRERRSIVGETKLIAVGMFLLLIILGPITLISSGPNRHS